jgi:uncharacterized protein YecT (DUF1311 family)
MFQRAMSLLAVLTVCLSACGSSGRLDLHTVAWKEATVPGSICGAFAPEVRLHAGHAIVKSTRWPRYRLVEIEDRWDPVVYGDIDGDGHDEAAVGVYCSNGSGTADGALAYARVIYTADGKTARVLAIIRPPVPSAAHSLPPLIQVTHIGRDEVRTVEGFYTAHDSTCCPSGSATTTWRLVGGKLAPDKSQVFYTSLTPLGASAHANGALGPPVIHEPFTVMPCPPHPRSTLDLEGCAEHALLKSDHAINVLANRIFKRLAARTARAAFVRSERAWLSYRRSSCSAESSRFVGGTARPLEFGDCEQRRNRSHLQDIFEIDRTLAVH